MKRRQGSWCNCVYQRRATEPGLKLTVGAGSASAGGKYSPWAHFKLLLKWRSVKTFKSLSCPVLWCQPYLSHAQYFKVAPLTLCLWVFNTFYFSHRFSDISDCQRCIFRWDISVICPIVVFKLAVTAFTRLPFRTWWPNWPKFFRSYSKKSIHDRKKSWQRLLVTCIEVGYSTMLSYEVLLWRLCQYLK